MMGLGKTIQAIALIWIMLKTCDITEVKRAHKALVVCPSSLIFHWKNEVIKWLGPKRLKFLVCTGDKATVLELIDAYKEEDYELMIISYDTFRNHGYHLNETVDLLVCDEGHKIKNRKIHTAKALNSLSCKRRIILTGTPIQNNLDEFFTLVDFINPGIFINYKKFKKVYTDMIQEG